MLKKLMMLAAMLAVAMIAVAPALAQDDAEVVADAVRFLDRKPGAPTAAAEGSGTEAEPEGGDGADDVPF